jgi:hypothetical protein
LARHFVPIHHHPTVDNDNTLSWLFFGCGFQIANALNHIQSGCHFSKNNMFAVKTGHRTECKEELTPIAIRPIIRHTEQTALRMLHEIFILEPAHRIGHIRNAGFIDGFSPRSIATRKVTSLDTKGRNNAMDLAILVAQRLSQSAYPL